MSSRIGDHIRSNVFAYIVLFLAVTIVPVYAASKVKKNSVGTKQVKDGQIKNPDLAADAVTSEKVANNSLTGADINESTLNVPAAGGPPTGLAGGDLAGTYPNPVIANAAITIPKLAFDPATQPELDALAAVGTINQGSNPVDWTQLKNVPAGFADGVDDIGVAGPAADVICTGCVGSTDILNDAVTGADVNESTLNLPGVGTNTGTATEGNNAAPPDCVVGEIHLTAGSLYSQRELPANGQLLSVADPNNALLFAVIGTIYGGDGVTNFQLPDLQALAPDNMTYTICREGTTP